MKKINDIIQYIIKNIHIIILYIVIIILIIFFIEITQSINRQNKNISQYKIELKNNIDSIQNSINKYRHILYTIDSSVQRIELIRNNNIINYNFKKDSLIKILNQYEKNNNIPDIPIIN